MSIGKAPVDDGGLSSNPGGAKFRDDLTVTIEPDGSHHGFFRCQFVLDAGPAAGLLWQMSSMDPCSLWKRFIHQPLPIGASPPEQLRAQAVSCSHPL